LVGRFVIRVSVTRQIVENIRDHPVGASGDKSSAHHLGIVERFCWRLSVEQRYEVDEVRPPAFASEETAGQQTVCQHEIPHGTGNAANRRTNEEKR